MHDGPTNARSSKSRQYLNAAELFDERPHAFIRGRATVRDLPVHRQCGPIIFRTPENGAPQPHRYPRLRRKHAHHCPGFVPHLLVGHDLADNAEGRGFFGAQGAPAEQELERAMPADNARQMHKMNCLMPPPRAEPPRAALARRALRDWSAAARCRLQAQGQACQRRSKRRRHSAGRGNAGLGHRAWRRALRRRKGLRRIGRGARGVSVIMLGADEFGTSPRRAWLEFHWARPNWEAEASAPHPWL